MTPRDAGLLEVEGFVLAGGRSIRMGQDKALLDFNGMPLVQLALRNLGTVTESRRIVGDRPDLTCFAPVVPDLQASCGPLGGICAALKATSTDWNLFQPVDVPLLPAGFLRWMVRRVSQTRALATVPAVGGMPQPLIAIYHRALLPELEQRLMTGDYGTIRAIEAAVAKEGCSGGCMDFFHVETLAAAGHFAGIETGDRIGRWFENLNRPVDLENCAAS
ncbi:MAG TPA: molybdenum cofactor guanylyltransferase [Acidisarcina sp.]|nr:molybdenum cofactor guanylyltransferase [Acidisarcina sp.]